MIQIIYIEHYALIVSDEKIENGKYYIHKQIGVFRILQSVGSSLPMDAKKVIAHRPLTDAPVLEGVPLLPEFGDEDDTVDNLVKDYITEEIRPYLDRNPNQHYRIGIYGGSDVGFRKGYNKAKETYKYTEEDLRKAFQAGESRWGTNGLIDTEPNEDEIVQSLQQPKRPKYFECKYKPITPHKYTVDDHLEVELKTITNSQGQTELVGTYYYE
jgi:hypothetical protein